MKKLLIAAVCFTAIVSMSSCTDDSSVETQKGNSTNASVEKINNVTADGDGPIPPIKK